MKGRGVALILAACGPKLVVAPPPEPAPDPWIERVPNGPLLLASGLPNPQPMEVDARDVYFGDQATGDLFRVRRDGSGEPVLIATSNEVRDLAIDATHVYWTSGGSGRVLRIAKDGCGLQVLVSGQDPWEIAVDDRYVYWSNGDDGSVNRIAKGGGTPDELATGQEVVDLIVDDEAIYWSDDVGDRVVRAPKDAPAKLQVLAPDLDSPGALALDGDHLYWSDAVSSSIHRVPRRGGKAQLLLTVPGVADIAVDERHVYWTDEDEGAISRVPKDGKGRPVTLVWDLARPRTIVVAGDSYYFAHSGAGAIIRRPKGAGAATRPRPRRDRRRRPTLRAPRRRA